MDGAAAAVPSGVSGNGDDQGGTDEDAASNSGESGGAAATSAAAAAAAAAAQLFIKRSVDEDFANNNSRPGDDSRDDVADTDGRGELGDSSPMEVEHDSKEEKDQSNVEEMDEEGEEEEEEERPKVEFPSLLNMNTPVSEQLKEQLKNISLTISQLSSNIATHSSPKNVQELAVLQATLFSLQQQQILQMQILSQIQQQQLGDDKKDNGGIAELARKMEEQNRLVATAASVQSPSSPPQPLKEPTSKLSSTNSTPLPPTIPPKNTLLTGSGLTKSTSPGTSAPTDSSQQQQAPPPPPLSSQILDPNAPSNLASSIIIHHDDNPEEKPVNSLELLQKRAQGILNNASQGLLANNLADFSASRDKEFDKKGEPFFKHRCRYCGKVFGSDSALQIHVRSHTGERPYKCNVCGNRFTTKGNLKVHFQRHSTKFPHVKMNPNLVPEHLDKFYPPLLQQIEEAEKKGLPLPNVNNPMAGMTPVIPPGFQLPNMPNLGPAAAAAAAGALPTPPAMPRFPLPATSKFSLPTEPLRREDVPVSAVKEQQSRPPRSRSSSPPASQQLQPRQGSLSPRRSPNPSAAPTSNAVATPRSGSPGRNKILDDSKMSEESQDEPENLTTKSNSASKRPRSVSPPKSPPRLRTSPMLPFAALPRGLQPPPSGSPLMQTPNGPILLPPNFDPAKDPNIYTNLLPRPGSNDNAWESLIEVCRASETSKLEQLVNNIEHKLSDPNECVICHRVLSCKSALQMHYRTHTGERPFKCRICGRAFTTKGNLKTHMGVHRAKPPMRMFHQCPVCHKKYANALVLQQHIRTHTGEPTELTQEQINAAEIKDFPPLAPFANSPFMRLPGSGLFPGLPPTTTSTFSGYTSESQSPEMADEGEDRENSRPSSVSSSTGSQQQQPATSLVSLDSLAKLEHRPFSLVRPFLMDKPPTTTSGSGAPEDLSATRKTLDNGKKDEEDEKERQDDDEGVDGEKKFALDLTPKISTSSPITPAASAAAAAAAAAAAVAATPQPSPLSSMFSLMPTGLLPPPSPIFANSLLGAAAAASNVSSPSAAALSQLTQSLAASQAAAFNPLRLPFPGVPSGVLRRKCRCLETTIHTYYAYAVFFAQETLIC